MNISTNVKKERTRVEDMTAGLSLVDQMPVITTKEFWNGVLDLLEWEFRKRVALDDRILFGSAFQVMGMTCKALRAIWIDHKGLSLIDQEMPLLKRQVLLQPSIEAGKRCWL